MLLQLGALFSGLLKPIVEAGVGIGSQFLNRELTRSTRRREKDLLKLRAQATGAVVPTFSGPSSQAFGPVFSPGPTFVGTGPSVPFGFPQPSSFPLTQATNGTRLALPVASAGRRRFTRTLDGCNVQHFRFDGTMMRPIEDIPMIKGPRFRFDQTKDKFVSVPRRRMNPLNFRAAQRSFTRIDRTREVCKRLFREVKKQSTGPVQRKKKKK